MNIPLDAVGSKGQRDHNILWSTIRDCDSAFNRAQTPEQGPMHFYSIQNVLNSLTRSVPLTTLKKKKLLKKSIQLSIVFQTKEVIKSRSDCDIDPSLNDIIMDTITGVILGSISLVSGFFSVCMPEALVMWKVFFIHMFMHVFKPFLWVMVQ